MSVPWVDLTDPDREPTDEELEALMRSVRDKAVERARLARARFWSEVADSIARAARGETASDPSAGGPEEETPRTNPRRANPD